MMERPPYIVIGTVIASHGLRGAVVVYPETDFPERFAAGAKMYLGEGVEQLTVRQSRPYKRGRLLVEFEEVVNRDRAEKMRHQTLTIERSLIAALDEDSNYIFDLEGMEVVTDEGEQLGQLKQVLITGANDVYVVVGPGGEILLPAIREVILQVDVPAQRMIVHLLPGLR